MLDEKGSIVRGDEAKYKELVKTVTSPISKSSPALKDFHFSGIAITKGWPWAETITDHMKAATSIPDHSEPHGERAFLTWAATDVVMTRTDISSQTNMHGGAMRWHGRAMIKLDKGGGKLMASTFATSSLTETRKIGKKWNSQDYGSLQLR